MMIRAAGSLVAPFRVVILVDPVLARPPLLKAALGENLVPEMPLTHIGCAVTGIVEQLGHGLDVRAKTDVVMQAAVLMRPGAGHDARPRGRADGLGIVAAVKDDAFGSELIPHGDA